MIFPRPCTPSVPDHPSPQLSSLFEALAQIPPAYATSLACHALGDGHLGPPSEPCQRIRNQLQKGLTIDIFVTDALRGELRRQSQKCCPRATSVARALWRVCTHLRPQDMRGFLSAATVPERHPPGALGTFFMRDFDLSGVQAVLRAKAESRPQRRVAISCRPSPTPSART